VEWYSYKHMCKRKEPMMKPVKTSAEGFERSAGAWARAADSRAELSPTVGAQRYLRRLCSHPAVDMSLLYQYERYVHQPKTTHQINAMGDTTYRTNVSNQEHSDVQLILSHNHTQRRSSRTFRPKDVVSGVCLVGTFVAPYDFLQG